MRGISQFIALMIVLCIVIGAGVFLSMYLPRFLRSQVPHASGELVIERVEVNSYGPKPTGIEPNPQHRIELLVQGVYQGTGDIEIRRVYTKYTYVEGNIYIMGSERTITVEFPVVNRVVHPNSYFKIYGNAFAIRPPKKIDIIIEYCFVGTNRCEAVVIPVEVNFQYTS